MNQCTLILTHLQMGKTLTQKDAIRLFGCYRLGARIMDLRQAGHNIITLWEKNHGHGQHARYALVSASNDNQEGAA